ncbi:hypothetical protein RM780_23345 [Streptomyces sp. DSM 44917]|uniref:Toxin-antitoxin system YwqK family antitoxin n=1 Tax=Streptomyces boetiae TaxID=3075541 RepID=A0ABU2LED9_9ACTN|nr:hypothetical protein [Streptomyces sp. DSM 44917]MDT0309866.1 hypothetical protein [Streptomyces sp. DSM 44917]
MITLQRINIDDPNVDNDFGHRLLYQGRPFTGEVEEYQGDSLISRETYTDGIKDGLTCEWYRDGTLRAEGIIRKGLVAGEFRRWHPNGTLAKVQLNSDDGKRLLAEYEWDAEGHPIRSWQANEDPD